MLKIPIKFPNPNMVYERYMNIMLYNCYVKIFIYNLCSCKHSFGDDREVCVNFIYFLLLI